MKIIANHKVRSGGKIHQAGEVFEAKSDAAQQLLSCGAASKAPTAAEKKAEAEAVAQAEAEAAAQAEAEAAAQAEAEAAAQAEAE